MPFRSLAAQCSKEAGEQERGGYWGSHVECSQSGLSPVQFAKKPFSLLLDLQQGRLCHCQGCLGGCWPAACRNAVLLYCQAPDGPQQSLSVAKHANPQGLLHHRHVSFGCPSMGNVRMIEPAFQE